MSFQNQNQNQRLPINTDIDNRLRLKRRHTRKNRNPSQIRELNRQVQQLQEYLYNFWLRKIKRLAFTESLPIEFFRKKYEDEIEIKLRVFIEEIYTARTKSLQKSLVKIDRARARRNRSSRSKSASIRDIFTSSKDIDNIKRIVSTIKDKFFKTIGRLIGRVNTSDFDPAAGTVTPRTPFNDVASMKRVAISAGYSAFNTATESKLEEINEGEDGENFQLEYVTAQDELVCEICEPFDGQIFEVDDADLPDLPQHENCRCYLEEITEVNLI